MQRTWFVTGASRGCGAEIAKAAVRGSHDFFRVESVFDGPLAPDARHRGSGIDENSVHIEEEGGALDLGHILELRRKERL